MTMETRTFICLNDLIGVEYACPQCNARICHSIGAQDPNKPTTCGNCGKPVFSSDSSDGTAVKEFIVSIHDLLNRKTVIERVRLEIKGLSAAEPAIGKS